MVDRREHERLSLVLKDATQHRVNAEAEFQQTQTQLSKDRTQYFEKITLGSGAAIAAVVSFVGSGHPGKLHPVWLLRSALIGLALSLIGALYRNWRHPYYLDAVIKSEYYEALRSEGRAKQELFSTGGAFGIGDGKRIDAEEWAMKNAPTDAALTAAIQNSKQLSRRPYKEVEIAEVATLSFAALAMSFLIALTWINF